MTTKQVRLGNEKEVYERLGIEAGKPHPKEDAMRTNGGKGSYEWWYTDAEFEDGTTVVAIFYTKNRFDVPGPSWPTVNIEITHPDSSKTVFTSQETRGTLLNASKDICDVKINNSYIRYEDGDYIVHFEDGDIKYHAVMKSLFPMWRPHSGHHLYGDNDEHLFAWFVAQPSASVEASLEIAGEKRDLKGTGYHDHNWGNIEINKLMNHWYWGRARVEGYTIIACDIITEKKYNYTRLPIFMIAKDGVILTDNQDITQITRKDTIEHPFTKKFMDNHLIYYQEISEVESYTIEFIRHRDISAISSLDNLGKFQAFVGRLIGANPTYARVQGEVRLTHELNREKTVYKDDGLWEQMFFGSNKHAIINGQ